MTERIRAVLGLSVLVLLGAGAVAVVLRDQTAEPSDCRPVARPPRIVPDCSAATIPPNIAPLNFVVNEPGRRYCVEFQSTIGQGFRVAGRDGKIAIPPGKWTELLTANRGQALRIDVSVQADDGQWRRFEPITCTVADEPIDPYLVYRRTRALFNFWDAMGIYQRDLTSYAETQLVDNRAFGQGCVNCHTFLNARADTMVLHTRGGTAGSSTVVVRDGVPAKVNTKTRFGLTGYTSWHPSGKLMVCAVVKVRQFFHTARREVRDVIDMDSMLISYWTDEDRIEIPSSLSRRDRLETYPCWAPDGRTLYFCSAEKLWPDDSPVPPERYADVRYDLMRVAYDPETNQWGEPETVLASAKTGLSITQPRVSPDGRWLVVCMADYGCFPIFQKSCDLHMIDLQTGKSRRLAVNSDETDSWHSWSTNGRWLVFSSKRGNGLFARPHISYVDADGTVHKPIVLPQEDPDRYTSSIMTYTVPELVTDAIPVGADRFAELIRTPLEGAPDIPVTGASPRTAGGEAWQPVPPKGP